MSVPRYWREIPQRHRLLGKKCGKCGRTFFPPRTVCSECGSRDLQDAKLSERGKVLTYTVIRSPPAEYERYAPYVVGIVELKDGVRVLSQIVDCDPDEVKTGMPVEATFRKVAEAGESGIIRYGFKFRPIIE